MYARWSLLDVIVLIWEDNLDGSGCIRKRRLTEFLFVRNRLHNDIVRLQHRRPHEVLETATGQNV